MGGAPEIVMQYGFCDNSISLIAGAEVGFWVLQAGVDERHRGLVVGLPVALGVAVDEERSGACGMINPSTPKTSKDVVLVIFGAEYEALFCLELGFVEKFQI